MKKLKILITAGPTREYIDPVRFITNLSTGTIGYLLAKDARSRGHEVVLLSGPTHLRASKDIQVVRFNTALELLEQAYKHYSWADCIICASAVGDYRPVKIEAKKIKKGAKEKTLELTKNPDVLKELGKRKQNRVLIGFALETNDLLDNARAKLHEKNLDFIVANKLSAGNNPFGPGKTSVIIVGKDCIENLQHISKKELARIILDRAVKLCYSFIR
ncbi:MAG: phosphopantothenoylcysteine decarboxylase [Candidatus Omnitrophota bacterium]